MSRMPRIQIEGAIYYITPAGDNNEPIFRDDADYALYLELLAKYKIKHNFKLFAFCLTPNNINLLIEPSSNSTISQIMHDLNPSYAKYFNGKYNKTGRLFHERYHIVLIEKAPNLLKMTAYVHLRPKLLRLTGDLSSYKYTSFLTYLTEARRKPGTGASNGAQADKLNMAPEAAYVLGYLKDKSYQQFVNEMGAGEVEELNKALEKEKVIGSADFRKVVESLVKGEREAREAPAAPAAPAAAVQPIHIEKPIALPPPIPIEVSEAVSQPMPIKIPVALPEPTPIEVPEAVNQPMSIEEPVVLPRPMPITEPIAAPQPEPIDEPVALPEPVPIETPETVSQPISIEKPVVLPEPTPTQIPKAAGRPAHKAIWIFAVAAYLAILFFALSVFFAYTNFQRMKEGVERESAEKDIELQGRLAKELDTAAKDLSKTYEAKLASYQATIELLEAGKRKSEDELSN